MSPHELAVAECAKLNFTEKAGMMHGFGKIDGYSRNSGCGHQCGRKTFRWDNGPQGFGDGTIPGSTTQWPSMLNIGATFDPELAMEWGTAMGEEFWVRGAASCQKNCSSLLMIRSLTLLEQGHEHPGRTGHQCSAHHAQRQKL
jgi:hypothetical protein